MNYSKLPKVELHLHLDCSLSYDVVKQLKPSITKEDYEQSFRKSLKGVMNNKITNTERPVRFLKT